MPPSSRIMVSLLLSGPMAAQWQRSQGQQTHVIFANDLTLLQISSLLKYLCAESAEECRASYPEVDPTQRPMSKEWVWTKHAAGLPYTATQAPFSPSSTKSVVGLNSYKGSNEGSSGNRNVVQHGLLRKLMLSFRADGSASVPSKAWSTRQMCCPHLWSTERYRWV